MKQFIAFVRKEFFHIFRDRRTMLILMGMPIVQIILFGFAITTEVKNVRVAVLDPSNDVVTRRIIDRVDASEYFTVTRRLHSPEETDRFFRSGDIDMAIVFSECFSDNLYTGEAGVQIISDATDPNMATMQAGYATNIIAMTGQEMLPPGVRASAIVPQVKLLYNPQMKSAYNFVPGVMGLILMLICAMMTSISIVREKETGTMEVLLVSPVKPLFIILAKAVPYFVLSFVNLITTLCLCPSCAGCGQPVLADCSVIAFYFRIIGFGTAHFYRNPYAGSCYAGVRINADDAYHAAFGNDISYREHACYFTRYFYCDSCALVYSGGT